MPEQIRLGIIGTGGIAGMHAHALKQIPEANVVGLCDIIPGRAEKFGNKHGFTNAKTFLDYKDMLNELELDAVSICTYNTAHSVPAIDCLKAGIPVLCEKPMSVTLDEAVAMARASKESGKILSIGFQPRYDAYQNKMREIVQSGLLGQVYYVETGGGRRRGIPGSTFVKKETAGFGAIADIGCYSLDMALSALGYPKPKTVSAVKSAFFGQDPKHAWGWKAEEFDVEDFGAAFVRLEGGITLYFKISWAMHMDTLGDTFFLGTEGGLKCNDKLTVYHDLKGSQTQSVIPTRGTPYDRMFTEKVRAFIMAVIEGQPAPIPGSQIVINQAIIDGILRSAEAEREVEVIIPEI